MLAIVWSGVIEEVVRALGYGNRVRRDPGLWHVRPDKNSGRHPGLKQQSVRRGDAPARLWHVIGEILSEVSRFRGRRGAAARAAGVQTPMAITVVLIVEEEPNLVSR